jgi:multisubunit Na+/H+ antiporter MnhC subunit
MRLYLTAIVLVFAATATIVNVCILKPSSTGAAPVHIIQAK